MKVLHQGQELRLKPLSDREYDLACRLGKGSGPLFEQCPTCGAKETTIPNSGGVKEFKCGTYKYRDEIHQCECQAQMALRARYLLANIGDEYQRLDWNDFDGTSDARKWVSTYLEKWENFKHHGWGLEFGGPQGVGKTFAATHIGKELVKKGEKVYLIYFREMVGAFESHQWEWIEDKMNTITFLILDELLPPISERQHDLYSARFEALMRHRTSYNLPTIITTNLTERELDKYYPRTYSLLAAKQERVDMWGEDARRGKVQLERVEMILNDEVRPIT